MSKCFARFALILGVVSLMVAIPRAGVAQNSSVTKIYTVPDGVQFMVDGTTFTHATSMVWPAGSKHILSVPNGPQTGLFLNSQLTFQAWIWPGGSFAGNPVTITADPAITEYKGMFDAQYGLNVSFYSCGSITCTNGPGLVYVNGVAISSTQTFYYPANATVILQAVPNPGFVFAGWVGQPNQAVKGFQNTVTMVNPTSAFPIFQVARQINLTTSPPGFQVLADRAPVVTPVTLDWGWDSVHSVGPISPQLDLQGKPWVFASWSDGGEANHAYTVAKSLVADTLTANFIPGVLMTFVTDPVGLSLNIDGRSNWTSYNFTWGVGETHSIQAPAQQTDAHKRTWSFSGWSNGGAASQNVTVPADGVDLGVRLTAKYSPLGHLTLNSTVPGVALSVDGAACTAPCEVLRPVGTQVKVSAPASVPAGASARQDLTGWSNGAGPGDLLLTLGDDAVAVTANYHLMNALVASSNPNSAVTWSMQPTSTDGFYDAEATVTVSVRPLPGFRFRNWTGDLSGSAPSASLSMVQPRTVRAVLDKVPYVSPSGVTNAAGGSVQNGVAPGSVISIFGANLADDTVVGPSSPMAQTLSGLTVRVGDRFLPLFFVSPAQINAQLPADLQPGPATLTISLEGQPDVQTNFTIVANSPGLFPQTIDGENFAVAFHSDGSAVTPDSPAAGGERIIVYGTGFGPTTGQRPVGFAVPDKPELNVTDPVSVQLGEAGVAVQRAFALPGVVGIDAVQILLGNDMPGNTHMPLTMTINGQTSNTVLLPLK